MLTIRLIQRPSSKLFSRFKSVKTDFTPEDTDDLGTNALEKYYVLIDFVVPVKLATGAELEFLGTSSACSTSTRNVSSLAFHYRKRECILCIFDFVLFSWRGLDV